MINSFVPPSPPPLYPIVLPLSFYHTFFELTITYVGHTSPSLILLLRDQMKTAYEGIFSENALTSQNKNWRILKFKDYGVFIQDLINKGNFRISQEKEAIILSIWCLQAVGLIIKKLEFRMTLRQKERPQPVREPDPPAKSEANKPGFKRRIVEVVREESKEKEKGAALIKKIKKEQTQPLLISNLALSTRQILRVLHFTSGEELCPSADNLKARAKRDGIELRITEDFAGFISQKTKELLRGMDAVLVSASININDQALFGDILTDFVEQGGNVVQIYRSCSPFYQAPKGRFDPPLLPRGFDRHWQGCKFLMNEHPILSKVNSFRMKETGDQVRALLSVNQKAIIDLVASWDDNTPLIGVRKDMKGLLTTMGFDEGVMQGAVEGLQIIINALRLRKIKF